MTATYSLESPENKKVILMNLIDAMTAAAGSQSYIQFIELRSKLIKVIDANTQEDIKRIETVKSVVYQLNDALPGIFTIDKDTENLTKYSTSNLEKPKCTQDVYDFDDLIKQYIDTML